MRNLLRSRAAEARGGVGGGGDDGGGGVRVHRSRTVLLIYGRSHCINSVAVAKEGVLGAIGGRQRAHTFEGMKWIALFPLPCPQSFPPSSPP